jgi:hypothetical protein
MADLQLHCRSEPQWPVIRPVQFFLLVGGTVSHRREAVHPESGPPLSSILRTITLGRRVPAGIKSSAESEELRSRG